MLTINISILMTLLLNVACQQVPMIPLPGLLWNTVARTHPSSTEDTLKTASESRQRDATCGFSNSTDDIVKSSSSHRPEVSKQRHINPSRNHHPYMKIIYHNIEKKCHYRWSNTDVDTIRGIEPFSVLRKHDNQNAVLKFRLRKMSAISQVRHVELVLVWRVKNVAAIGPFKVYLTKTRLANVRQKSCSTQSLQHRQIFKKDGQTYHILNVTSCFQFIQKFGLEKSRKVRLEVVTKSSEILSQILGRPLLILYYHSSHNKKLKRDLDISEMLKRSLRIPRHYSQTASKLCSHCVYGVRKDPKRQLPQTCGLHQWYVTLEQLQWDDWVVAPSSFQVNYCSGQCEVLMRDTQSNTTNHARIRTLAMLKGTTNAHLMSEISPPHCVPIQLQSTYIIYVENGMTVLKRMDNMLATRCGCR